MDRDRFSESVRRAADTVGPEPIRASQLAQALLELHPDEYGAERLDGPLDEPGADRTVDNWLERCAQIVVPEVVDGRLVLLALGRLDERLGLVFRRSGVTQHLDPTGALVPWADRRPVRGYRQRARFEGAQVAGFTDDALILDTSAPGGVMGTIERWQLADSQRETIATPREVVIDCAVASDGAVYALMGSGEVVDVVSGRVVTRREDGLAISIGGTRLAILNRGGSTRVHDLTTGAAIGGPHFSDVDSALSWDGLELAVLSTIDPVARIRVDASTDEPADIFDPGNPLRCVFSRDGRRLAVVLADGRVVVRDGDSAFWDVYPGPATACAFSADGTLLVIVGLNGVQAVDVLAGVLRGDPTGGDGSISGVVTGPDGLVATSDRTGTTVWEPAATADTLAAVSPDTADGVDQLGITADANALADLIAAKSTVPPLSIGLFADWGSGKSFLIRKVQQRVRVLSAQGGTTHCSHVRNVEFNAWHFADANLWASLATHILDELAKPEPGESDETAAAQLARLEERLAAESATGRRLERAHRKAVQAQTLRRLAVLAVGRDNAKTLGDLKDSWTWLRLALVVLVPIALIAALVVGVFGLDEVKTWGAAAVAAIGTYGVLAKRVAGVLEQIGPTSVESVKTAKADAEAAKAHEATLRQEYEDLAHGRALARYAAARGAAGDYRAQLGLISRIHDDFERMTELLLTQGDAPDSRDEQLPQIDRVVLYIDDLDRCSPKRVVEVLEAVHLILALPLFVVVIAVDPRWLLQSLKLHYAELLAAGDEPAWESTPLAYLEKIIQIPFALRPMGADGTASLVGSLLPVYETSPGDDVIDVPGIPSAEAVAPATPGAATTRSSPAAIPTVAAAPAAVGFNPRALVLTEAERDFAALVATELRTPRAVKKLTNIYRLVRARLDEDSDDFSTFLEGSGTDIPDYQAVLILLTAVIAFPDRAADLLLKLDEPRRAWSLRQIGGELGAFLNRATGHAPNGATTSTEPFRRWARELARYSFEAGQEVYAKR